MMGAESVRNVYSVLAVVNKKQYCPKLHFVGSLYRMLLPALYFHDFLKWEQPCISE